MNIILDSNQSPPVIYSIRNSLLSTYNYSHSDTLKASKWCRSLACSCPQRLGGLLSDGKSSLEYPEYQRLLDKPLKKKHNYLNRNVICNVTVFQRAFFFLFTLPTEFKIVIKTRRRIPDPTNKLSFANFHDAAYQSWLITVKVKRMFKLYYWTTWRYVAVSKAKSSIYLVNLSLQVSQSRIIKEK